MSLGDIFKGVKNLGKIFDIIPRVGRGLKQILNGVEREFTGLPIGVYYGAIDTSIFIQYIWEFAFTNFTCGMKLMNNIFSCIFYYILDAIGQILYILPRLLFWIIDSFSGKSKLGTKIETTIWGFLDKLDRLAITYLGFHIIHFSKSVRDMCYNCKRLKPTVFIGQATSVANDLVDPILPLAVGGVVEMVKGLSTIVNAFRI
jgi:hypothetical protein